MANFRFPKRMRLVSASDFERVFAARASASDQQIIMYAVANNLGHPRLGLAVTRKVGGAVERNRWKRAIREAFRLTQHELPPLDFVCLPRTRIQPNANKLGESLTTLAARLRRKVKRTKRLPDAKAPTKTAEGKTRE